MAVAPINITFFVLNDSVARPTSAPPRIPPIDANASAEPIDVSEAPRCSRISGSRGM